MPGITKAMLDAEDVKNNSKDLQPPKTEGGESFPPV